MKPDFRRHFVALIVLGASVLLAGPAPAEEVGPGSGVVNAHMVLRMTRHMGLVAGSDNGPRVVVWEDGAVDIHYPAFMKRAGDYRLQLSDTELEALVSDLIADGLSEFDATLVREELAQKAAPSDEAGRVVSQEMDRGFTEIEYRLPAADKEMVQGVVRWTGLQSSARQHPDVDALQDLAGIERRLLNLVDDPRTARTGH
jgi:hypothetical protein